MKSKYIDMFNEAIIKNDVKTVETMITDIKNMKIADVALQDIIFYESGGWTAIKYATAHNFIAIVKLLIENQADVNYLNVKHTAICYAAMHGHQELIKLFIDAKADIGLCLPGKFGPLSWAKFYDQYKSMEILVSAGAGMFADTKCKEFFEKVCLKDKVVIGFEIEGKRVSRETAGFEQAITNVAELRAAINMGVELNRKALRVRCHYLLQQYPNNKELKAIQSLLYVFPQNSLLHCCLNRLNKKDPIALSNRAIALDKASIIPTHLQDCLLPIQEDAEINCQISCTII